MRYCVVRSQYYARVLCSPVLKCLTCNSGVLGWSLNSGSSGFFVGVSLAKILQSPSLELMKPRKYMNNVSRHRDRILFKPFPNAKF